MVIGMVPQYLTVHSVKAAGAWGQEIHCPPPQHTLQGESSWDHTGSASSEDHWGKGWGRAGVDRTCLLKGPFCARVQSQGTSCYVRRGDALC